MKRREFLSRAAGLAAGLVFARRALAQAADGATRHTGRADDRAVTLAVAGDTTLGYNLQAHIDEMLLGGVLGEQLWPLYPRGIRDVLDAADLAMVNLECPFTVRGEKLPKNFNFRARPELVKILES